MSSITTIVGLASLIVGLVVGKWAEARLWRDKAVSGFRKESGGRLYHLTHADQ